MIAALYVAKGGVYCGLTGIDPWDVARDARRYNGPHRVIAHPPCARWGNYWFGSPSSSKRLEKGADGGCFAAALASVREWGGVLEHPRCSRAWSAFGLNTPPARGWQGAGDHIGAVCEVEQGHYGHQARKGTWLYAVRCPLLTLMWGRSSRRRPLENLSHKQRAATPIQFRDQLITLVGGV